MSAVAALRQRAAGVADGAEQLGARAPRARGSSCPARASRRRSSALARRASSGVAARSRWQPLDLVPAADERLERVVRQRLGRPGPAAGRARRTAGRAAPARAAISRAARSARRLGREQLVERHAERRGDQRAAARAWAPACRSRSSTPARVPGRRPRRARRGSCPRRCAGAGCGGRARARRARRRPRSASAGRVGVPVRRCGPWSATCLVSRRTTVRTIVGTSAEEKNADTSADREHAAGVAAAQVGHTAEYDTDEEPGGHR